MLMNLFKFKGGVKPPTNKTQSVTLPIAAAPLPSRLVVPLHQSIGGMPRPVVQAGDKVLKGQLIGEADGWISAAVHAPTSGTVVEVAMHVQPHPSGLDCLCVVIEPDGRDEWIAHQPFDYANATPDAARNYLQQSGVVGLGGAVFPTHGKLTPSKTVPMEELVINGAECEPFITCDDLLMRERAEEVVRGIGIFRDLLQPEEGADRHRGQQAGSRRRHACRHPGRRRRFRRRPGADALPGRRCQAVDPRADRQGSPGRQALDRPRRPVLQRRHRLHRLARHRPRRAGRFATGHGHRQRPRAAQLRSADRHADGRTAQARQPHPDTDGIVMGGPMMGFLVPNDQVPVVKATNCLIAHSPRLFPPKAPEMPCIRCGACAEACPHELQPFEMYWFSRAKNFGKTQEYAHLRLHRMRLLLLRLPVAHPAGPVFPLRQERDLGARTREERRRPGQGTLRVQAIARRARKGREGRKAGQGRRRPGRQEGRRSGSGRRCAGPRKRTAGCPAKPPPTPNAAVDPEKDAKRATIEAAMARAKAQREAVQPRMLTR
jgi:electron transport complex protein RnfC